MFKVLHYDYAVIYHLISLKFCFIYFEIELRYIKIQDCFPFLVNNPYEETMNYDLLILNNVLFLP